MVAQLEVEGLEWPHYLVLAASLVFLSLEEVAWATLCGSPRAARRGHYQLQGLLGVQAQKLSIGSSVTFGQ